MPFWTFILTSWNPIINTHIDISRLIKRLFHPKNIYMYLDKIFCSGFQFLRGNTYKRNGKFGLHTVKLIGFKNSIKDGEPFFYYCKFFGLKDLVLDQQRSSPITSFHSTFSFLLSLVGYGYLCVLYKKTSGIDRSHIHSLKRL